MNNIPFAPYDNLSSCRRHKLLSLLIIMINFLACAPHTYLKEMLISGLSPKSEDYPIIVFKEEPKCPYDIIAEIYIAQLATFGKFVSNKNQEDYWTSAKSKARELGGDAILYQNEGFTEYMVRNRTATPLNETNYAKVIKFPYGMDCEINLISAAEAGNADLLVSYIKKGIRINISDDFGTTPLMKSAEMGHIEIIKMLLDNGADPQIRDKNGMDALDYARNNNQTDAADLLLTMLQGKQKELEEFQQAISIASIDSLKSFLSKYPISKYRGEVFTHLEKLAYQQAKQLDTVQSYANYLDEYPKGVFTEDAKMRIRVIETRSLLEEKK